MKQNQFKYICACCEHEQYVNYNIGTICPTCNWEYNPDGEGDDPYMIGPNGCHVDSYRSVWIRAGKPIGKPRWLWNEEVN